MRDEWVEELRCELEDMSVEEFDALLDSCAPRYLANKQMEEDERQQD